MESDIHTLRLNYIHTIIYILITIYYALYIKQAHPPIFRHRESGLAEPEPRKPVPVY